MNDHYPDVMQFGNLAAAIDDQLVEMGSSLRAKPSGLVHVPVAYARFEQDRRFSQVYIAKDERLFLFDFWDRGVMLAQAKTPLLPKVAEAINAWVKDRASVEDMQRFDFIRLESKAKSHQAGAAVEVEEQWQAIAARCERDLLPLLNKAMEVPVLRQLFPFTSMYSFCFSRCTGYPFSGDCPFVLPEKGQYRVFDAKGKVIGIGDVAAAIDLLVQNLPANCGPAVQGTIADLE